MLFLSPTAPKSFNTVFKSDEFAKQYLVNQLKLSDENLVHLNKSINLLAKTKGSISNGKKEKPRKRVKGEPAEPVEESFTIEPPKILRDIFMIYCKCVLSNDIDLVQKNMNSLMDEFKEGNDEAIDTVIELATKLKLDDILLERFQQFTDEEGCYIITGESGEVAMDQSVTLKIFGQIKGLFVINSKDVKRTESERFETELVLFTNCGLPLLLHTTYSSDIDSYRSNNEDCERLAVYSRILFNNSKQSNQHGYFDTEVDNEYDAKLLKNLQTILLHPDTDKILEEEGHESAELTQIKKSLIYSYLQCAFGSKKGAFSLVNEEWVPFSSGAK